LPVRWLLVIGIALGGCQDREAARLETVKNAVCACKTASCAELAMKDVPKDDTPPSRKSQKLAREMLDCLAKLYAAERPSTDPDQPQP
jgi:hypothetical protein